MQTTHDDRPHPVPPYAYARYKENWFFIIIDPANGIMGMAHFSYEPLFNRARVSCNVEVKGKAYHYSGQTEFPADFAYRDWIGDDRLKVRFIAPHERIDLSLDTDDLKLDIRFDARAPTFNFELADAANPDKPTSLEVIGLGISPVFQHHQQASRVSGTAVVRKTGETITLDGLGYRDHSRGARSDNLTKDHVWTCLQFDDRVFGIMQVRSTFRPEVWYRAGYVWDTEGMRALSDIAIDTAGLTDENLPETVTFRLRDVYGQGFEIGADVANRYCAVPLNVEAATSNGLEYTIFENFVDIVDHDSGAKGLSLLEIGFNSMGRQG